MDTTRLGLGLTSPPSDHYRVSWSRRGIQTAGADSPIGHLSTGDVALGREVIGDREGPKLGRLPLNSDCPGKADGLTTRCRNAASRSDTHAFDGMHWCPVHHRGVEIVRMHSDVDHLLNNNRITAGIITAALRREGAAMSNGHFVDPVSTRETLYQNVIHNRRIVGEPTALVPLFPNPAP